MTPNERRLEMLRQLARQYRPQCVIELIWQACLTYDVESHRVRRLAEEELRLPYLRIETDYSPSDSARIAMRVEALFETVRGSKLPVAASTEDTCVAATFDERDCLLPAVCAAGVDRRATDCARYWLRLDGGQGRPLASTRGRQTAVPPTAACARWPRRSSRRPAGLPAAAIVLTTTCDQVRYAAAVLEQWGKLPVFLMHVPRTWQTAGRALVLWRRT